MPFDRFLIAPFNEGLVNAVRPWLIPDNAFERLTNAYVYESRIRKKMGSQVVDDSVPAIEQQLGTRVRVQIGVIIGNAFAGNVPGIKFKVGQQFSVLNEIFSVAQMGLQPMLSTGTGNGTYDTATGAVTINVLLVPNGTPVYFYPAEPIMGIRRLEVANTSIERTIVFDTQFAYEYTGGLGGGFERLDLGGASAIWTSTLEQFFWTTNYQGQTADETFLFVTNYNVTDNIRFLDPVTNTWATLIPVLNLAGDTLLTAKIIVEYKNRMLAFNTIENVGGVNTTFVNRLRYSQEGDVTAVNAWRQDIGSAGGSFVDAPTQQTITAVEFVRDKLVVYCEESTWEIIYTGSEVEPFRWQQIDSDLGVNSTFSIIPLDKVAVGVGTTGVHICNGNQVERIDQKIYHEVYQILQITVGNFFGPARIYGIRDFFSQLLMWTFPDVANKADATRPFSNRVFVYNYASKTWAFFEDSINCFGYFWSTFVPNSLVYQAGQQMVMGGNSQGFVFLMHPDFTSNASVGGISNIDLLSSPGFLDITAVDHNLIVGDRIIINNAQGLANIDNLSFEVVTAGDNDFSVAQPVPAVTGVYTGGATFRRVSRIDILTKEFNFYAEQNKNAYINQVNFLVDRTDQGEFSIDYFASTAALPMVQEATASGALQGTGVIETSSYALEPLEAFQSRIWHPTYLQTEGDVIQMRIFLSDAQIDGALGFAVHDQDFQMHAFLIFAQPTGYLR